ncbi:MAG: hypothetical protein N2491_04160 [Negativicutes bacterium]|nr:hypothetical protein [Negativicutes bacterium]
MGLFTLLINADVKGIVYTGTGNGSIVKAEYPAIEQACSLLKNTCQKGRSLLTPK